VLKGMVYSSWGMNGTRVVFAEAWDIFPECIVPAGTAAANAWTSRDVGSGNSERRHVAETITIRVRSESLFVPTVTRTFPI
jgi:hypothetical protein